MQKEIQRWTNQRLCELVDERGGNLETLRPADLEDIANTLLEEDTHRNAGQTEFRSNVEDALAAVSGKDGEALTKIQRDRLVLSMAGYSGHKIAEMTRPGYNLSIKRPDPARGFTVAGSWWPEDPTPSAPAVSKSISQARLKLGMKSERDEAPQTIEEYEKQMRNIPIANADFTRALYERPYGGQFPVTLSGKIGAPPQQGLTPRRKEAAKNARDDD